MYYNKSACEQGELCDELLVSMRVTFLHQLPRFVVWSRIAIIKSIAFFSLNPFLGHITF